MLVSSLLVLLSAAPVTQTYGIATSTGRIGTFAFTTTGNTITVDFKIDENGRGPKVKETITLDAKGKVLKREMIGQGGGGAPVQETFAIENGHAKWDSLDEHGKSDSADGIYVDANGSVWGIWQLTQALLAAKKPLPLYPSGTARLEKLREVQVVPKGEKLQAAAIWGASLTPTLVLLRKDKVVGMIAPGGITVEEPMLAQFGALNQLAIDLTDELFARIAKSVTHHVAAPLWLTHVRVFDSATGKLSAPKSVVVFRGVVTEVTDDAPPANALSVDGGGGTLLPGLIDAHSHFDAMSALIDIATGVTYGVDRGNDNETLLAMEKRFDAGELVGPHVWKTGFLEGKSPFSAGGGFVISTLDEGLEKVRWYAEHGYWGIKIYNSMNPDFVKPLAAEAHRLGLHVSGHVPAFMNSERAMRDGYDEINHINQLLLGLILKDGEDPRTVARFTSIGERAAALDLKAPPFQKLLALMKEKHVALDPTMTTMENTLLARPGTPAPNDVALMTHVPASVSRTLASAWLGVKPEQFKTYDASYKKLQEVLVALDQAGVPLVPGTDSGISGLELHGELEEWVRSGIPAPRTLSQATLGAAKYLGREQSMGSIAPGRVANLYLVDGDPTQDITTLRQGKLVMKGDAVFFPDEIFQAIGVTPFTAHATIPALK